MSRFYRSTREAFPVERFPAVFGPYRKPSSALSELAQLVGVVALFATLGVIAAWRF